MLASLDRMDSDGHYTPDDVYIVCRFMSRWKGTDGDVLGLRLLSAMRKLFRCEPSTPC